MLAAEYRIPLSCPRCGGVLEHRADGRPTLSRSTAVCWCGSCRRTYRVEVRLVDVATEALRESLL